MFRPLVLACLAALALPAAAAPLGTAFTYQGRLTDGGQPANELYDFEFCLFADASGGTALSCAPLAATDEIPVEDGVFTAQLDFGAAAFAGEKRFLELRVRLGSSSGAFDVLAPRQLLTPAPEALRAAATDWSGVAGKPPGFADNVDDKGIAQVVAGTGVTVATDASGATVGLAPAGVGVQQINTAQVQARLDKACAAGEFIRSVDASGAVTCAAGGGGTGTVTQVTTGTGLTGGPITSTGQISIAPGGVGLAQIDTAQVQARLKNSCGVDVFLKGISANGDPVCDFDQKGVTSIATGTGLQGGPLTSTGTISIAPGGVGAVQINTSEVQTRIATSCAAGQAIRAIDANGGVTCQPSGAGTVTQVTGGTGLTGSVTTSGSISIANNGVGLAQINPAQVQARVTGACQTGEYFRAIGSDGSVICEPLPGVPMPSIHAAASGASGVGLHVAMALGTDGLPAISFFDDTTDDLKFVKCVDASCAQPAVVRTLDSAGNVGEFSSIAVRSDNRPVISYHDNTNNVVKILVCSSADCSGAPSTLRVMDAATTTGVGTAITLTGTGQPVVAYPRQPGEMKVAWCFDSLCSGSIQTSVIEPVVAARPSIALGSDDLPIIAYFDMTAQDLKIAKCTNLLCTTSVIRTPDSAGTVGDFPSIAVGPDGNPVISYIAGTNTLRLARCATADCNGAPSISVLDPTGAGLARTSLSLGSTGTPSVAYHDAAGGNLKFAKCFNQFCNGAAAVAVVDATGTSGDFNALAILPEGLPLIAYHVANGGISELRVAKCNTSTCQ